MRIKKPPSYLEIFFGLSLIEKLALIISVPMLVFIIRMIFSFYE